MTDTIISTESVDPFKLTEDQQRMKNQFVYNAYGTDAEIAADLQKHWRSAVAVALAVIGFFGWIIYYLETTPIPPLQ